MKKLHYIFVVLFSCLIIISGVGVSIMNYCCAGCETMQSCCPSGCSKCSKSRHSMQKTCRETGCAAVHYKVDLVNHTPQMLSVTAPAITLFYEHLPHSNHSLQGTDYVAEALLYALSPSVNSRHYLALYSILLI